jgi:hypothetical protein
MSILGMNGFEARNFASNDTDARAMERLSSAAAYNVNVPAGTPSTYCLNVYNTTEFIDWDNDASGSLNEPVGAFWLHIQQWRAAAGGNQNDSIGFGVTSGGSRMVWLSFVDGTGELTLRTNDGVRATSAAAISAPQWHRFMVEFAWTGGSPTAGDTIKVYEAGLVDEGSELLSYTLTAGDVTTLSGIGSGKPQGWYLTAFTNTLRVDDMWAMDTGASVVSGTNGDTTGGTTFTSAGATFLTDIPNGGAGTAPSQTTTIFIGGTGYTVSTVVSDTELTLASAPPSGTGVGYKVYSYVVATGGAIDHTAFKDGGIRGQAPTSDGSPTNWARYAGGSPTAGASFSLIDDISATTDFLQASAVGVETQVQHAAIAGSAEKVAAVKVYANVTQTDTTAGANIGIGFDDGVTSVQKDSAVPATGYITNVYDERSSGVDWTPANYDGADIKIISVT